MPRKKSGTENELWERMPGESVRHYEYFCAYRDMRYVPAANADDIPKLDLSRERSIRKLAQQLGVAKRTIGDLCSRFNWVARCDAYDLYILRRVILPHFQNAVFVLVALAAENIQVVGVAPGYPVKTGA